MERAGKRRRAGECYFMLTILVVDPHIHFLCKHSF